MALLIAEAALMSLREQKPRHWRTHLQDAQSAIQRKRRLMKLGDTPQDTADAMYQCLVYSKIPSHYLMAAACLIDKLHELKDKHIALEISSLKTFEHLKKLEQLPWSIRNIAACKEYYLGWIAKYHKQIDKIIGDIRVLERDFKGTTTFQAHPPKYPGIFRA